MTAIDPARRSNSLRTIFLIVLGLLLIKVMFSILWEYQWYFPADFEHSTFLSGRRYSFAGVYRAAFYAHLISGPIALCLGLFMVLSGGRARYLQVHRTAGRSLMLLVLIVVVPSGLVMARQAYAGPIAGFGFGALSLATAASAAAAWYWARARDVRRHRRWATRCFILLTSPLLLRLIAGGVIVLDLESAWTYRLNAWCSWLIPLAAYELWWRCRGVDGNRRAANGDRRYNEGQPTFVEGET